MKIFLMENLRHGWCIHNPRCEDRFHHTDKGCKQCLGNLPWCLDLWVSNDRRSGMVEPRTPSNGWQNVMWWVSTDIFHRWSHYHSAYVTVSHGCGTPVPALRTNVHLSSPLSIDVRMSSLFEFRLGLCHKCKIESSSDILIGCWLEEKFRWVPALQCRV